MGSLTFDLNGLYGRTDNHLSAVGNSLLGREPTAVSVARFWDRVFRIPSAAKPLSCIIRRRYIFCAPPPPPQSLQSPQPPQSPLAAGG